MRGRDGPFQQFTFYCILLKLRVHVGKSGSSSLGPSHHFQLRLCGASLMSATSMQEESKLDESRSLDDKTASGEHVGDIEKSEKAISQPEDRDVEADNKPTAKRRRFDLSR
jgi:hypothetical protein